MARADDIRRLKESCEEAIKQFYPKDETTYANLAVDYVARCCGYNGFIGLTVNLIIDKAKKSADFCRVEPDVAQKLANDGRLVIAGIQDDVNGHIAICYPGAAVPSKKWGGRLAPVVANVGALDRQKIWGANFAFGQEPKYYAWIG